MTTRQMNNNVKFSPFLVLFLSPLHAVQIINRVMFGFQSARWIEPDVRNTLRSSFPVFFFFLSSAQRAAHFSLIEKQRRDARGDVRRDRQRGKWILDSSQIEGTVLCEAGRVRSVPSHQPYGTRARKIMQRDGWRNPSACFQFHHSALGEGTTFFLSSEALKQGKSSANYVPQLVIIDDISNWVSINITNFVQVNSIISQPPELKLPLITVTL